MNGTTANKKRSSESSNVDSEASPKVNRKIRRLSTKRNVVGICPFFDQMYNLDLTEDEESASFVSKVLLPIENVFKRVKSPPDKLIQLDSIPPTWTLNSIAKLFSALYEIAGSSFIADGLSTLKAILEMGLKLNAEDLNIIFRQESYTGESSQQYLFVEEFLALTVGKSANFKKTYYQIFGKPYGFLNENLFKYADAARMLISWLTSYIILNVYIERNDVKTRRSTSTKVNESIVRHDLSDVYLYYIGFLERQLTRLVELNLSDFHKAKFIPTKSGNPTLALSFPFLPKPNQFTAPSASSQKNGCEVTGINAVEKTFVTTSIQKLYDKYQHKTNLPEKCNLTEFMMVIDCLVHKEFKDMPERGSSENSQNADTSTSSLDSSKDIDETLILSNKNPETDMNGLLDDLFDG